MPSINTYIQIQIPFNTESYDVTIGKLYRMGIDTFQEEEGTLIIFFDKSNNEKAEMLLKDFEDASISEIENQNWNEEWEKTIEPVWIKDKIVIYPSWKRDNLKLNTGQIGIEIDPKMSFGTGHNATTQLVLELICRHWNERIKYFLDFGSGTGVLSIAAIKMGADKGIAIDIDEDAESNCAEYFTVNFVDDKIQFYRKSIDEIKEKEFDAVFANIISSVILENLSEIYNRLKPEGKLFCSGILQEEVNEILFNLKENKFEVVETAVKDEWAGIYAVKKEQ